MRCIPVRGASKYHARQAFAYDGTKCASIAEMMYYNMLLRKGVRFTSQQKFEISDDAVINGKHYAARTYRPDFCIYDGDNLVKVVDVKGGKATMTTDARLRIVLFTIKYRLPVTIAHYDYKTGLFTEEQA